MVICGSATVIFTCANAGQPPMVEVAATLYVVVIVGVAIGAGAEALLSVAEGVQE
jgi:hypothetical protein